MPRSVQLSNAAYALLKSVKEPTESFSDAVTRLASQAKDPRRLRRLRVRKDFDVAALRRQSRAADLHNLQQRGA